ncbi:MAG: D-alanine-D-alanine ligase [Candidatus Omnitrophota bacterium]
MKTRTTDKIGVLMGGYSSEREISLKSGLAVYEALKEAGRTVVAIDIVDRNDEAISEVIKKSSIDVAFIALHGALGEDGRIQNILDNIDVPFTGSNAQASAIAIDKAQAQKIFFQNDIKVANFCIITPDQKDNLEEIKDQIDFYPVVIKPSCEGSSLGILKVDTPDGFVEAVIKALDFGQNVIVEQYIQGREFTVGILNGRALPVIEIKPESDYFDYEAKYKEGMTEYIVPAALPAIVSSSMQSAALKAHRLLRCEDFSRVDFLLSDDLVYYLLEINTIPGFTQTSLLPKAAKAEGIDFQQLCLQLVSLAYGKEKERK